MPVNQEIVEAACDVLKARGLTPTVELVRRDLPGGGSPNAITPLVRTWKDAERARRSAAEVWQQDPLAAEPRTLPLPMQRVIEALTATVANVAPAANAALAEVAETERRRSALDVEAARATAQAQIEDARREAGDERATTDLVRQEVDEKDIEIERLMVAVNGIKQVAEQATERACTLAACRT